MEKKLRIVFSAVLVAALVLVLGACSKEDKVEMGISTGTLKEAAQDSITISSDDGLQQFKTTGETVYDLGGMDELNLDDVVDVEYHSSGDTMTADKIILREHVQKDLTFNGQVVDVTDKAVTVTGKSLTVSFTINDETEIKGELSKGDEVALVYMGDLNEYPYASVINVSKEADKVPEKTVVSGTVTEFTEKSMLVAIDSSTSYRFELDKNTSVTGASKYVRVGDTVKITFEGDVKSSPKASNIDIVKEKSEKTEIRLVNGTIESVAKNYVTLNTGKKVYMIQTGKNTKYTGDKPAKGYKSEIQYTGTLSSGKAQAINIYCVKQAPTPTVYKVTFVDGFGKTLKTVKVEKGKAASAPANPQHSGYKFKGWDKSFNKVTKDMTVTALWEKEAKPAPAPTPAPTPEPEPKPEPEPSEQTATVDAVITEWTSEANPNSFKVKADDQTELGLNIEDDLDIPSGYLPAVGDKVRVTYMDKSMKLIKMELLEKAKSDDKDKEEDKDKPEEETKPDDQKEETKPEDQSQEETQPEEKQEEAQPEEKQEEPAPAPEPEPEPAPEPEPVIVEPEPDVIISGEGIIEAGDPATNTFTVTINGSSVKLNYDKNSKYATGYFPQKGDKVKIEYNKSKMLLNDIQLIERPVPAAAEAPAEG